jgi:hypothetical protein
VSYNVPLLLFWLGSSIRVPVSATSRPSAAGRPRMRFWSLDLTASEWSGPQALTRSHPVPTCINSCDPRHPRPGGNTRRFAPSLAPGGTTLMVQHLGNHHHFAHSTKQTPFTSGPCRTSNCARRYSFVTREARLNPPYRSPSLCGLPAYAPG